MPGPGLKMTEVLERRVKIGHNLTTLTIFLLAVGGVSFLYFWGLLLPWLIDIATNTLILAGLCGALTVLAFVFLNKDMRTRMSYAYQVFTRWLTKRFVLIDRIAVLETHVARYKARMDEMDMHIGKLKGETERTAEAIKTNEEEREKEIRRAKKAEEVIAQGGSSAQSMRLQLQLASAQAKRLRDSNKVMQGRLTEWQKVLAELRRLREGAYAKMLDTQATVDLQKQQSSIMTSGYAAFDAARRALGGERAEQDMFDMALDSLSEEYYAKMGEIDNFLDNSKNLMNGVDLDKLVAEDEAREEIAKLSGGSVRVDASVAPARVAEIPTVNHPGNLSMDELFDVTAKDEKAKVGPQ